MRWFLMIATTFLVDCCGAFFFCLSSEAFFANCILKGQWIWWLAFTFILINWIKTPVKNTRSIFTWFWELGLWGLLCFMSVVLSFFINPRFNWSSYSYLLILNFCYFVFSDNGASSNCFTEQGATVQYIIRKWSCQQIGTLEDSEAMDGSSTIYQYFIW